ncbi:MAG: helix-hairpin-helix domain-containing protein [Clostridia bacterium]|nr:helix-hairpin-helix domain-containing protein [Clostridia bacterium]
MKKIKEIISKYKLYIVCIIVIILSIVSIILQNVDRKNLEKVNSKEYTRNGQIAVYITGAVKNPGVYYIEENSRLNHLLDICGGILENADINKLNLAQRLVDSDKIIVPIKQEDGEEESEEENEKVNINTAPKEELMTLNGIGEGTASKIMEYRKNQEFLEIEDIMNISGIGENKFNDIKDSITV